MIAPTATYFQIAPRESFARKPGAFDQSKGRTIPRLNISFEAVQFQFRERKAKHQLQRLSHITLTGVRRPNIITKVRVLKSPAKDLAEVNRAGDGAIFPEANEQKSIVRAAGPLDVLGKRICLRGWRNQPAMKSSAAAIKGRELCQVVWSRRAQKNSLTGDNGFPYFHLRGGIVLGIAQSLNRSWLIIV